MKDLLKNMRQLKNKKSLEKMEKNGFHEPENQLH